MSSAPPDDLADVRASLRGDAEAYRRLILRHQAGVSRQLLRFSRDPGVLEELVHDTFVETYFALPRYRFEAPFTHYLHRIATRVGYRFWKRRQKAARVGPLESAGAAAVRDESASSAAEASEVLSGVLARLSPRDRLVVTLLYLEERSVAETAELTGWSQTMVKVQAFRARARLRKLLGRSAAPKE